MSNHARSLLDFIDDPQIESATLDLTKYIVTVFVEGESDWLWLNRKINRAIARIEYEAGNDGGKRYVIDSVNRLKSQRKPVIGLIDRDLSGWCAKRDEQLIEEVFDTEVRDAEVMITLTEALIYKLEVLAPPKGRNRHITLDVIKRLQDDALSAAMQVGAIEFVNANRKKEDSPLKPYLSGFRRGNAYYHFHGNDEHRRFDLDKFLDEEMTHASWKKWQCADFKSEVKGALTTIRSLASEEATQVYGRSPMPCATDQYAAFLFANGHVFLDLVAKGWIVMEKKLLPEDEPCEDDVNRLRTLLERGLADSFELLMFKQTKLHEKVETFCDIAIRKSIFRLA